MAEVVLKNVKKIYPIDDSEKKKKDDQGEQKKTLSCKILRRVLESVRAEAQ